MTNALSEYGVVDILSNNFDAITQTLVNGFEAVAGYNALKSSTFDSVYGSENSAWSNLQTAKNTLNSISDKGSQEYYNAQEAYNTALREYQSGAEAYKTQYGNDVGWDDGITQEQREAWDASDIADSFGRLSIKKSGKDKNYVTGLELTSDSPIYQDLQKAAYDTRCGSYEGTLLKTWKYTPGKTLDLSQGGTTVKGSTFRNDYNGQLSNWAAAAIAEHPEGTVFSKSDDYSKLGIALGQGYLGAPKSGMYMLNAARKGSLGLGGGPTLLNEEGTEAIITPSGTITSLPSKTGVVPADVTKSVWQLGELAPSILRALGYAGAGQFVGNSSAINNMDSVNIGSVYMQVSADASFDPKHFVEELKAQAALSKNNRR